MISLQHLALVAELLESSSSDSEDEELLEVLTDRRRVTRPKVVNFINDVVHNYDDEEFRRNFRVQRAVCYKLIADYEKSVHYPKSQHHGGRKRKTAEEHMLAFLWFAGNKSCLRDVSSGFNMAKSTLHYAIERVASFLDEIGPRVVKFSNTSEEKAACAKKFETASFFFISGFPNVIRCIEGSYVETRRPVHKICSTYVNRHDKATFTLQAICDADRKFLDVFCGPPGKTHDAKVYKLSFIKDELPEICCAGKYHILGDAAYPVREHLITPFRDYGKLTQAQRDFNFKLSQTRVKIENAFGVMKARFRQLLLLEFWRVKKATKFMLACCVLHNLCILNGDDDFLPEEDNDKKREERG
ncbi:unnamed protein product [Ixodes persulcatus]